jgi:hypothetical protein
VNLAREIQRKVAFAIGQIEERVRPLIVKETTAEYEEWKRNHPRLRVCYFCKRRHRRPHLLFVVDSRGRHRRWASRKCFEKKYGMPLGPERGYGVWEIHV